MSLTDWVVLALTIVGLIGYGLYRSRRQSGLEAYLTGGHTLPWWQIGLSVMATQASAVTFLSGPGQAYVDGMRFVQFYFGLPLAMIVIAATFIPIFRQFNVLTAYAFLEERFDLKTRTLAALLFLVPRWLSTGISIYAPSIILSVLLGWDILLTNFCMGGLLLIYTVIGGSKAISYTHIFQMLVVLGGMSAAAVMVVRLLPPDVGFTDTLHLAGKLDRLNTINWKFDLNDRYNVWSGLIGGFFLQLSYFGTDQSQVGRYLGGETVAQSRLGLLMNGLLKIPMQFGILLIGAMLVVFYQFHSPPLSFNTHELTELRRQPGFKALETEQARLSALKNQTATALHTALKTGSSAAIATEQARLKALNARAEALHLQTADRIRAAGGDANDTNYIFLEFVMTHLPRGLVGLIIAVIFLASMGSISAAIQSLTSSTVIDIYRRMWVRSAPEAHYVRVSRWCNAGWGLLCIGMAMFASRMGSLIEAVNVLGSLFYGTILGVFLVAFYAKNLRSDAVFWGAVGAEALVVLCWWLNLTAFLWLNLIGCVAVAVLAWGLQTAGFSQQKK